MDQESAMGHYNPLEDLCQMLGMAHRAFLEQRNTDPQSSALTMETHWLIRRLIEQQTADRPGDMHLLLDAALMARDLDPDLAYSETGSCVSLLRKAVSAIERNHAENAEEANSLLALLQAPR
jgi:hypothetical protein